MAGRGEAIAREDNYCEIDPNTVDKYGIPVLRFHYKWSDHEVKQAKHMKETFEIVVPLWQPSLCSAWQRPGHEEHEDGMATKDTKGTKDSLTRNSRRRPH